MKYTAYPVKSEICFKPVVRDLLSFPDDNSYFWLESLWMRGTRPYQDDVADDDEPIEDNRCPYCGQIVSDQAEKCSHCGKPLNMSLYQRVG